ncbi:hypothetical protein [Legionella septentrionalis]|uniref:Uncharacterized protein n=1 Tax=Legionella septentrionalis TaxID=2498109 RepID=A0A433JGU2_9GAMM|nr:hypothetical protein [Legionella septentrionalis]RUQ81525.1 hypothetical protein EKM59_10565 [Legionella septentrionalis]
MDTKDEEAVRGSKIQTNCFAKSALAIDSLHGRGKLLDIPTIMQGLIDGAKKITDGHTKEIEQMLFTHAKTLDYVFYDALSQLADCQMINQVDIFANIAFRAQNQSRKALLALAELKNPRRATFIKQQNNAVNQQINNSKQDHPKEFKKCDKVANELLELKENEQWMDRATQGTPIKNDPPMEALGAFDRCKDKRRQGYKQDE